MKGITFEKLDGSKLRIGIVVARWNSEYTTALLEGCKQGLRECGVEESNIVVQFVPGSYELIHGTKHMIDSNNVDAVVSIGTLIKGETMHFEYIAEAVTSGIREFNTKGNIPVIFGVLTCLTEEQVQARSTGENNHGVSWGKSAVEMALLKKQ